MARGCGKRKGFVYTEMKKINQNFMKEIFKSLLSSKKIFSNISVASGLFATIGSFSLFAPAIFKEYEIYSEIYSFLFYDTYPYLQYIFILISFLGLISGIISLKLKLGKIKAILGIIFSSIALIIWLFIWFWITGWSVGA